MDGLALASGIVSFVAFAWDIGKTIEEYRSSVEDGSTYLTDIKLQLPFLREAIKKTLPEVEACRLEPETEASVRTVVTGCKGYLESLQKILDRTKKSADDTLPRSTMKALRFHQSKGKLIAIRDALQGYVALLILHHVMSPSDKLDDAAAKAIVTARETLWRSFVEACRDGDTASVEELCNEGADPDWRDDGWPQLCRVSASGRDAIVRLLIQKGADPTAQSRDNKVGRYCSLYWAAKSGHPSTVRILLENDDAVKVYSQDHFYFALEAAVTQNEDRQDIVDMLLHPGRANVKHEWTPDFFDRSLVWWAVYGEQVETVKALVERGADLDTGDQDGETPLMRAVSVGRRDVAELLIVNMRAQGKSLDAQRTNDQTTAVLLAASSGRKDILTLLLDHGASPCIVGDIGRTPLHVAKDRDCLEILLKHGADPTIRDTFDGDTPLCAMAGYADRRKEVALLANDGRSIDTANDEGVTPLLRAIQMDLRPTARTLWKAGAAINLADHNGKTALHYAAEVGSGGITADLLGRSGIAVDAVDKSGYTALSIAAGKGFDNIVRLLLEHSADRDLTDEYGDTPLDRANDEGHATVVALLQHKAS